jgi:hypothetical protein
MENKQERAQNHLYFLELWRWNKTGVTISKTKFLCLQLCYLLNDENYKCQKWIMFWKSSRTGIIITFVSFDTLKTRWCCCPTSDVFVSSDLDASRRRWGESQIRTVTSKQNKASVLQLYSLKTKHDACISTWITIKIWIKSLFIC